MLIAWPQVRNARLAMLGTLGFAVQAWVTGKGPLENAIDHLKDPFGQNSAPFHLPSSSNMSRVS
jgi:hypothetical protein